MSKMIINQRTLTNIGDAIREKTGSTEPIPVVDLADEIRNLDIIGDNVTGLSKTFRYDIRYFNLDGIWDTELKDSRNYFSFKYISNARGMFKNSELTTIKYGIGFEFSGGNTGDMAEMFYNCKNLTAVPTLTNSYDTSYAAEMYGAWIDKMFYNCQKLKTISTNYLYKIYTQGINNYESALPVGNIESEEDRSRTVLSEMFSYCCSLRNAPYLGFFITNSPDIYKDAFRSCYALEAITNYPVTDAELTTNEFSGFATSCYRLGSLTFGSRREAETGPKNAKWKNQNINLTAIGYTGSASNFTNYNSGITADKAVSDDATYQALKDDPDWWGTTKHYSRYNKVSAINTINSLPDTSTYLATNGGTNTITFLSGMGSLTDGGSVSGLSSEEIAVAASKGWTVAFA